MSLLNTLLSDFLRRKSTVTKLLMVLFVSIITLLAIVTLVFSELQKQDISKSQLEIEKNRVAQIDKQLTNFYSKTYSSNRDSLLISKGYNKDYFLKQIEFLKKQREDAVKNIDGINENPDTQILIFTILASVLTISILTFFTNSFKSTMSVLNRVKLDKITTENKKKFIRHNQDFLVWATTNEIAKNNLNGIDLEKAKSLKEIYDNSEKLGDDRNEFLNSVIKFTNLKRKQEEIQNDTHSEIYNVFENIQERLKEECDRLNRQALINLFLCFFIAFSLMSFITYTSIMTSEIKNDNTFQVFLIKYIPRIIAITSLLTMFLYFTKLYKTNIIDVKYYQNELTNVEIKQISLKTALLNGDKEIINKVITDFSNIERNLIMNKEQTTNEIERIKIENEINKDYLNKVWELLSITKNKE